MFQANPGPVVPIQKWRFPAKASTPDCLAGGFRGPIRFICGGNYQRESRSTNRGGGPFTARSVARPERREAARLPGPNRFFGVFSKWI